MLAHNGPLDPAREARVKADYPGYCARYRLTLNGLNSDLPPNPQSALQASAEELEATFEQRWRIGGFAYLGAFSDLMTDPRANALAAEFVRGKIRQTVTDPATAEMLCPKQAIGCKRLCVDSLGYYETFNRPNVKLVDVSRHPIEAITPGGLVAGGRDYQFDSLVLANRLRRRHRHANADGPARPRRTAHPGQVAQWAGELSRTHRGRIP